MGHRFHPGEPAIYTTQKVSTRPGPRAREVAPMEHGDGYTYLVDKFWWVQRVTDDGKVELVTRRGKKRICDESDRRLKKPGLLTRLLYRRRFPVPSK